MTLILDDVTGRSVGSATGATEAGMPTLVWRCDEPGHQAEGCLFCDPAVTPPDRFFVLAKPCCGVLSGDYCDCLEFAAEADKVFAEPIVWDLTGGAAA